MDDIRELPKPVEEKKSAPPAPLDQGLDLLKDWFAQRQQQRAQTREQEPPSERDNPRVRDRLFGNAEDRQIRRERLRAVVGFLKDLTGVDEIKPSFADGKLQIDVKRQAATKLDLDRKEGPMHVKNVEIAKDFGLSISLNPKDKQLKIDDIWENENGKRTDKPGIKVKGVFDAGFIKQDVDVSVRSATLERKDEKPQLKVEVAHPSLKDVKIPITIPLVKDKTK